MCDGWEGGRGVVEEEAQGGMQPRRHGCDGDEEERAGWHAANDEHTQGRQAVVCGAASSRHKGKGRFELRGAMRGARHLGNRLLHEPQVGHEAAALAVDADERPHAEVDPLEEDAALALGRVEREAAAPRARGEA